MLLGTCLLTIVSLAPEVVSRRITAQFDVIVIDLSQRKHRVSVVLSEGFPDAAEQFSRMMQRRPRTLAAINGSYFDKSTLKPIGDIWMNGELRNKGLMGTALCIRADNSMDIRRVTRHRGVDWSEFETVLACGPALVLDGAVDCDWQSEGFRDPHVTGSVKRMGVGITQGGKLVLVRGLKSQTFEGFAQSMLRLGCYEAMNLDAGASRAFFYNGKVIEAPGRKLTNILTVETAQ